MSEKLDHQSMLLVAIEEARQRTIPQYTVRPTLFAKPEGNEATATR
jgi:hypothetical protein